MALARAIEKSSSLKNLQVEFTTELNKIKLEGKTVVAFSFMSPDVFSVKKEIFGLRERLKKSNNEVVFVAGGPHPSGAPEQTLRMGFDYVFVGEGEKTLVDFLADWQKDKLPDDKVIKSKPVDITKYPAVSPKFNLFGPIEISRGCPFGCKFCQTTYLFGSLRHRTIDQIVWAAKQMSKRGLGDIRFVTPNLLGYGSPDGPKPNLSMLEKMLIEVKEVKGVKRIFAGSFPSEIRPEQITKEALLIIKKYCNNDNIIIGAQSGSDRILELCHRGHKVEDVYRAIDLALEIGFKVNVDFIFGMPGEKPEDEEETMKVIRELVKKPGVRIHSHTFLPLAGTPWGNEAPGKISPRLRKFLKKLRGEGKEFGDWEEQEVFGQKLYELFSNS